VLWNRAKEELERKIWEETQKQRRPSRFEVMPAPDIFKLRQHSTGELIPTSNLAGRDVNGVSGQDHGADRAGNRREFSRN
jgi:chloride channel 2